MLDLIKSSIHEAAKTRNLDALSGFYELIKKSHDGNGECKCRICQIKREIHFNQNLVNALEKDEEDSLQGNESGYEKLTDGKQKLIELLDKEELELNL